MVYRSSILELPRTAVTTHTEGGVDCLALVLHDAAATADEIIRSIMHGFLLDDLSSILKGAPFSPTSWDIQYEKRPRSNCCTGTAD